MTKSKTKDELFDELMRSIKSYHPSQDLSIVERAYKIADEAHEGQMRKSGEPYIIHPLSVAIILADLGLDLETIVAGLLHDVIEDTKYDYDDIKEMLSEEIADLVDGVTKLEKIGYKTEIDGEERHLDEIFSDTKDKKDRKDRIRESKIRYQKEQEERIKEEEKEKEESFLKEQVERAEELQAENYRKMFLAMAKDIRVIIIKIADRLHNMRTLNHMKPEKQRQIAQETLDIYSPLAHRLGISKIRYELEDLSFRYLDPDSYYDLAEKIVRKQSERIEYIEDLIHVVEEKLVENGIDGIVEGRPKHFFSIYKKMIRKNITLDQVYDLFAVRVIVNTVMECYEVLGIIHEMYKPIQGRFKDYISMPKENMYQSLHTTLIGPEGEPVEIQIRTWEMHRVAEYGIAAHWKYKGAQDGTTSSVEESEEEKLAWLRQILEWQRDLSDNREYLSELKTELDIFQNQVYVFSPRGKVVSLPSGASPIDFAYKIHSDIGDTMIGARVNGAIVPFDYELKNSDRVEIITSKNSTGPKHEWLSLVKTSQARSRINAWFRRENKEKNVQKGKELLVYNAKQKGFDILNLLTEARSRDLLKRYGFRDMDSLFAAVGHGGLKEGQVINWLIEEFEKEEEYIRRKEFENLKASEANLDDLINIDTDEPKKQKKKSGITVKGVGDLAVRLSKCCNPVPGDNIIAYTTRGRGVSIHRVDCNNILNLNKEEQKRLIEAEWALPDAPDGMTFRAELSIICEDRMGLLADISAMLNDSKIPVRGMIVHSDNQGGIVFRVTIEISSREQLDRIYRKLLDIPGVEEISRVMN